MESWIQFAGLFFGMIGTVGGLGFFFLKSIDRIDRTIERLDRNYDAIQQELKIMHGRVCKLEERRK